MRWRFLLRPEWVALTVLVIGFSYAAFTLLAPWQFRRGDERAARNAAIEQSFTSPPRPLREVLAPGAAPGSDVEWRQVQLTGRYLPDAEVVARLRTVQGEPAYEVLIPLQLTDGSAMLIDRGYLRPAEGVRIPQYPAVPGDEVTVTGRLQADEPDPRHGEVVNQDGHRQVYAVNAQTVRSATGIELAPGYVELVAGSPGVLSALPLPELSDGPHLSYALQWIAFGVMAPLGLGYFVWREACAGRPEREPDEPGHRQQRTREQDDPHDPPQPSAALADRYRPTA